jgi:GTP diphosphokinase / guanosine-3',5'-bis(diphosphate) 3'-diphosphatase
MKTITRKEILEKAIRFARRAHKGQKDVDKKDYILHSLEVARRVKGPDAKIVAVLHDVLEDTKATAKDLKEIGVPQELIEAVRSISRKANESYISYLRKVKKNKLAAIVKLVDISHNKERSYSLRDKKETARRIRKYNKAYEIMKGTS